MLNRSTSLAMSTSALKALPGNIDIKSHSPSIPYVNSSNTPQRQHTTLTFLLIIGATTVKELATLLPQSKNRKQPLR